MSIILLNLQSNQRIKLESDTPVIIGRENVKGCYDKRVSRKHARITCTVDGKVRLLALHCNPCFFKRKGVPPVQQLNKDQEETLNEGDYLGLLPNAFWFRITSDDDNLIKNEMDISTISSYATSATLNETVVSTETFMSLSSHPEINAVKKGPESSISNDQIKDSSSKNSLQTSTSKMESNSGSSSRGYGTPEFEKTKRLPLWMYEIEEPTNFNNSANKHSLDYDQEIKGKKQKVSSETEIKKESEVQSDVNINVQDIGLSDVPATSTSKKVDETSNSTCFPEEQEEAKKDDNEKEVYENSIEIGDINSKRPICQYEGNCYRENPQHKLEFSHPGDSDYIPYEKRPFCRYGGACYRRSEKHKTEFRHPPPGLSSDNISSPSHSSSSHNISSSHSSSWQNISPSLSSSSGASSPLPPRQTRKNVLKNFYYEDDDENDVEDPFANDASSDEYLPSDVGSEEEDLDTSRE